MFRIGNGFDIHKFGGNRPLVIGGVFISCANKIVAHSDGDVMIHAIIDALLGAVGFGDIGRMFPNTNMKYSNVDSRKLLRFVWKKISDLGYFINNIDITLILQQPEINVYFSKMSDNIAKDLVCAIEKINVKATTAETLGCLGRSEGVACIAVVLLSTN